MLSLEISGKQITYMTTRSDPQLRNTYNIMHMLEFTYNLILIIEFSYSIILITGFHISRKSLEQRSCTEGTRRYITNQSRTDYLCFLVVHYSYSYHINVCLYRPIAMNERDTAQ